MMSFMVSLISVLSKRPEQTSICALPKLGQGVRMFYKAGDKMVIAPGDWQEARRQKTRERPPNFNNPSGQRITAATEMCTSKPMPRLSEKLFATVSFLPYFCI